MDSTPNPAQNANYLSPHFSLNEMTFSQWAVRNSVANTPSSAQVDNLRRVAAMLEGVRVVLLGNAITVTSGFRNVQVNWALGGVENSAHVDGLAVDFIAPDYGTPADIMQRLLGTPQGRAVMYAPNNKTPLFDQLILEGRWVHLGLAPESKRPRGHALQATFRPKDTTIYTIWKAAV